MTNAATYLPGDRVTFIGELEGLKKPIGTVVPSTATGFPFAVKFDDEKLNAAHSWADSLRKWMDALHFDRQPIEPGCWVRELPGENIFSNNGKPEKVIDMYDGKAQFPGFLGGTLNIDVSRVARVAEPKPAVAELITASVRIGDVLFEAFPDGTTRNTVMASGGTLSDPLKQAQALAKTLDEKHFSGTLHVLDTLPGVLNQIDHLTAYMVRKPEPQSKPATGKAATLSLNINTDSLADTLREFHDEFAAQFENLHKRVTALEPQPTPTFKRGDLVTWGSGGENYRIVGMPEDKYPELMTVDGSYFRTDIIHTKLRHVEPAK